MPHFEIDDRMRAMKLTASTQIANPRANTQRFNPIRNLRPDTLSRSLEAFESGRLGSATRIFEAILQRDDIICGLNLKRKKSVARLEYDIELVEDTQEARQHQKILRNFYSTLESQSFSDGNIHGGVGTLINQMMDSVGMRYSVHKIELSEFNGNLRGKFIQYPLWLFENTQRHLRLLDREGQLTAGKALDSSEWMITCGDGLMIASSVAYMFKHLSLRDWLIYCERNGMPGIKAKTDAFPGTPQWDNVCEAVRNFGAEFHAVFSEGTEIDSIDVSTRGELPYPKLIERIDRMMTALWRGSDLSTLSAKESVGASMQWYESSLIEEADASNISETLNRSVDKQVIKIVCGEEIPLARFKLKLPDYEARKLDLEIIERLTSLGLEPDKTELARRFAYPTAHAERSESHEE